MSRACRVRSVYGGLSQIQHGMSDIACSVQICTNTFNSTTNTSESTMVSTTQTTARGTELRCHKWIDISYRYANSLCFVRQEAAELGEAPAMHFSFSSCCFADVGQVLQDYLGDVRIDTIRDDLFAYVVVSQGFPSRPESCSRAAPNGCRSLAAIAEQAAKSCLDR